MPVALRFWSIIEPVPALAPLTPSCTTVQLKVVPVTCPESSIEGVVPEQIDCVSGLAATSGVGLTVMVKLFAGPVQPLAEVVTLMVASTASDTESIGVKSSISRYPEAGSPIAG